MTTHSLTKAEMDALRVALPNNRPTEAAVDAHLAPAVGAIVAAHTADLAAQVAAAWDEGVDAAFRGAVTRQNGDDVKRRNPYRTEPADPRTHGLNHAPLPEGTLLDPGFCAGCDALRAALSPAQADTEGA